MSNSNKTRLAFSMIAVLSLFALGCGSGGGNHDIPAPPQLIDGKFVMAEEQLEPSDKPKTPDFDWSKPIKFEGPNKSRTNPFLAQKDSSPAAEQTSENSKADDGLRIKGFVNVNGLRVFLRVGDDYRTLSEGESLKHVEVLNIAPPNVTIMRNGVTEVRSILEEPTDKSSTSNADAETETDAFGNGSESDWGDDAELTLDLPS